MLFMNDERMTRRDGTLCHKYAFMDHLLEWPSTVRARSARVFTVLIFCYFYFTAQSRVATRGRVPLLSR